MWSSPLLLLVLVFTLTNSTNAAIKPPATTHPGTLSAPTSLSPVTTLRLASATTTTSTRTSTTTSTTTTAPVTIGAPYVSATNSSALPVALAPSASVSSGALGGRLTSAFPVATVPLQGPGSWTLATGAGVQSELVCANVSVQIATRVTIATDLSCQLEITSSKPGVSQSWQLTPIQ